MAVHVRGRSAWRRYLGALGPGVVTGASDDDPSGIATYSQAGAAFRFGLLWTALLTLPLMATVEEICDRTALATGQGLGELARMRFRSWRPAVALLVGALLVSNSMNIAADLVAVGSGMNLLHAGPVWLWSLAAGLGVIVGLVAGRFALLERLFKGLCLALLAYVGVVVMAGPDWGGVLRATFVPQIRIDRAYLALVIAVLGTTISPYLFFWQSAHRVEELREAPEGGDHAVPLRDRSTRGARLKERTSRVDVFGGMLFSNLVMWSIIIATGQTLGANGHRTIQSAAEAASALRPIAGSLTTTLFAIGFIGSGMLAVPVLAGSGAAAMSGLLGKRWGFSRSVKGAPVFYGLVALGTATGTLLSVLGFDPIRLLVFVATINGVAAAPFLAIVMLVSGDRTIMGASRNGRLATVVGWLTVAAMAGAALAFLVTSLG